MTRRRLRRVPLAAALALAGLFGGVRAESLSVPMPATWKPGDGRGVAALFAQLDAVAKARPARPGHAATTLAVTSCADDGGNGTLRSVISGAGEGDTLDVSTLTCGAIVLTQGAIAVYQDYLAIAGPGANALAIDGARADRVFVHYGHGTLDLQGLTVRNGFTRATGYHVTGGACVISNGYVAVERSIVSGCVAEGEGAYGGGITARGVGIYSSTLSGNIARGSHPNTFTAAYGGGAMAYRGIAIIIGSTITGNRATHASTDTHGSYCTGGGIFSDRGGYMYASTLNGNYSYGTGGGLATHGPFDIANSTLANNTARFKSGGGVFARVFYPMRIANSTIAANTSGRPGAGIYLTGIADALTIASSIVANNRAAGAASDIAAMNPIAISGANNLVTAKAANVTLPSGTLTADPLLAPLANNGGPTLTMGLYAGSPALGVGSNPNAFTNDQRGAGFPRTVGGLTDIGALQGTVAAPAPKIPAPALSAWALALLAGLLGFIGWRRRAAG
ncbi:MAG: IPTL-CTERM sorting domain-containing protein [Proteobacteria bacterium]|nr:IPTL-CTERM sorting domain-containing protein [Pseudomonadota bacterium]